MTNNTYSIADVKQAIANEGLGWEPAENELTVLDDEQRDKYLGVIAGPAERARLAAETRAVLAAESDMPTALAAPARYDWRDVDGRNYVTPVKNQGPCGSCVSFGTCAAIEAAVRIDLRNPNYDIDLSEGFLQFCGGGSCRGWGLTSGLDYAKSTGVTDEACMPYEARDMDCASERCNNWQSRLTKIRDYKGHASATARRNAIATKGPVVAGMAVYSDFYGYSTGIYRKTATATLRGYHCICVVGYNDTGGYWIVKNSWGDSFGMNGYCNIAYDQPDLLIDTDWSFYTIEGVTLAKTWFRHIGVRMVYATAHARAGWASLEGIGWRRIDTTSSDGVTNVLALMTAARVQGRKVTVLADGDRIYRAYLH